MRGRSDRPRVGRSRSRYRSSGRVESPGAKARRDSGLVARSAPVFGIARPVAAEAGDGGERRGEEALRRGGRPGGDGKNAQLPEGGDRVQQGRPAPPPPVARGGGAAEGGKERLDGLQSGAA